MFGQDLGAQMGIPAPQQPQQAPSNPMDEVNAKLDQILAMLMQDKQGDAMEGQNGATQPQLG